MTGALIALTFALTVVVIAGVQVVRSLRKRATVLERAPASALPSPDDRAAWEAAVRKAMAKG